MLSIYLRNLLNLQKVKIIFKMIWAGINREKSKSSDKGIGWALWLYGYIEALKNIFLLYRN